jgi:hypothetical protein
VSFSKVHESTIELQLGVEDIYKLNSFCGIVEIFSEQLVKLFDLFTYKKALINWSSCS